MYKSIMLALVLFSFSAITGAAVKTEEIQYKEGDTVMKGLLAYDDSIKGKRPAVLVVHEWWGHNAYARLRATMLAELGYTALAVDMYGDGKIATHPDDAKKFVTAVNSNMDTAKARFEAARSVLVKHSTVDHKKVAAIGYCFGGAIVLNMARMGVNLDGVVSFHGPLGTKTPAQKGKVIAEVLVYNGADDPYIKPEAIEAFKKEMDAAGVKYKFVNLPGAKHSFTNPEADGLGKKFNLPQAYNATADRESWQGMQEFLKAIFK
jgi:dienelactone hydrolase